MWNHEITLIAKNITGKDKLKQNITEEVKTVLLCRKKSIT
ncbi:phage head-tail adapter protein, partial [Streptococcus suis]|nr:phage head-tail adapter protein [Streptococcus suis]